VTHNCHTSFIMARPQQIQQEAASTAGKQNKKTSSKGGTSSATKAVTVGIKGKPDRVPSCNTCGVIITSDKRALQCDGCNREDSWKCAECLNISSELYDQLLNGLDLKWLCTTCEGKILASEDQETVMCKLDRIISMLDALHARTSSIEDRIEEKADKISIDSLCSKNKDIEQHLVETLTKSEQKVMQKISGVEQVLKNKAETNLLQKIEDRIKQLEDKPNAAEEVKKLAATVEKQRTDNHDL